MFCGLGEEKRTRFRKKKEKKEVKKEKKGKKKKKKNSLQTKMGWLGQNGILRHITM